MNRIDLETSLSLENLCFYDAEEQPFVITGVFREGKSFTRLPEAVAKTVNEGVYGLRLNTAGGKLRFQTDSDYVAIKVIRDYPGYMPHMAITGSAGFDLYATDENGAERYQGTFIPPTEQDAPYEAVVWLKGEGMKNVTLNFPLYSGFDKLYIGLRQTAAVLPPKPFKKDKPIVYYGSSITQGGCASRPGACYQNIIAGRTGVDHINLGFSGSGRGEDTITAYIAGLDMCCFVLDYDHNAPDPEHLKATHEKMYKAVRAAHPHIPIIMVTRPQGHPDDDALARKAVVYQTYRNALAAGDTNVGFVNGMEFFDGDTAELAQVDGCHPNDIGFLKMADKIGAEIIRLLAL